MEKYKLWQLRQKRGGGGGGGGGDKDRRQLNEMRVQISKLQTQLTRKAKSYDKTSIFSSDNEEEDEEQSDKNN